MTVALPSINTSALRAFGHLPDIDHLSDEYIRTHLESAQRSTKRQLPAGLYDVIISDQDHASYEDLLEAVYCRAMALLLPGMHTIYAEGINDLNENGTNTRWMNPAEIDSAIARYEKRAADLVAVINPQPDTTTSKWRYTLI